MERENFESPERGRIIGEYFFKESGTRSPTPQKRKRKCTAMVMEVEGRGGGVKKAGFFSPSFRDCMQLGEKVRDSPENDSSKKILSWNRQQVGETRLTLEREIEIISAPGVGEVGLRSLLLPHCTANCLGCPFRREEEEEEKKCWLHSQPSPTQLVLRCMYHATLRQASLPSNKLIVELVS